MHKLTLSAEAEVIKKAKKLARERGLSVSAMFAQFVRSSTQPSGDSKIAPGPLTRRAAGIAKLRSRKPYRQLIEEAIREKHAR